MRLFILMNPIEFLEIPEECEIELEFKQGVGKIYRCRIDLSYGNIVKEIYDKDDEIIATSLQDLVASGVTKATVILKHEIEVI